ncbi:hypothetical protein BS50DRAFT_572322 [Corynespora cassiicola Philippines]|uniref:Ribosomal protein S21 n=1 Tax=Corynespora cassiicola Philippines TaxID=1448308 RepID=A0A2T2NUT9_CORCC|nr:hypothetical protein BS50DRAFT_572322 [Corynespora cassiicola Philippines]
MSSRSLGELLLRPSPLSRISTSRPTTTVSRIACRTITNSTPPQSAHPQPQVQPQSSDSQQPSDNSQTQASDRINQLFANSGSPPRFTIRRSGSSEGANNARKHFGENFMVRRKNAPARLDFNAMMDAPSDGSLPRFGTQPKAVEIPESEKTYPRLNASYGRSIQLDDNKGRDIVRGLGMLGSLMARNKVKADVMRQRFHERPGLKRKRLNSERWRARFKIGFNQVTARVTELTRKGW